MNPDVQQLNIKYLQENYFIYIIISFIYNNISRNKFLLWI